jgi:hypothetical protein
MQMMLACMLPLIQFRLAASMSTHHRTIMLAMYSEAATCMRQNMCTADHTTVHHYLLALPCPHHIIVVSCIHNLRSAHRTPSLCEFALLTLHVLLFLYLTFLIQ